MEKKGKKPAMSEFNQGHWEKKPADTACGNSRYSSEMGQSEEYKKSVDGLANYVKKHKPQH